MSAQEHENAGFSEMQLITELLCKFFIILNLKYMYSDSCWIQRSDWSVSIRSAKQNRNRKLTAIMYWPRNNKTFDFVAKYQVRRMKQLSSENIWHYTFNNVNTFRGYLLFRLVCLLEAVNLIFIGESKSMKIFTF